MIHTLPNFQIRDEERLHSVQKLPVGAIPAALLRSILATLPPAPSGECYSSGLADLAKLMRNPPTLTIAPPTPTHRYSPSAQTLLHPPAASTPQYHPLLTPHSTAKSAPIRETALPLPQSSTTRLSPRFLDSPQFPARPSPVIPIDAVDSISNTPQTTRPSAGYRLLSAPRPTAIHPTPAPRPLSLPALLPITQADRTDSAKT